MCMLVQCWSGGGGGASRGKQQEGLVEKKIDWFDPTVGFIRILLGGEVGW